MKLAEEREEQEFVKITVAQYDHLKGHNKMETYLAW